MIEEGGSTPAITESLRKWREGDDTAFQRVMEYVYEELHRRASVYVRRERSDDTLQPTALVHEAFIKLIEKREIDWQDRNHFLAVAAQAMRRILVDRARARRRSKRGGESPNITFDEATVGYTPPTTVDVEALDEAMTQLASFDERQARIVELKYFGGMTLDETADFLGISRATVRRDWQIARAWLRQKLQ
jgi:RNA polymerase sigma-70 factor (ECF subfamily)